MLKNKCINTLLSLMIVALVISISIPSGSEISSVYADDIKVQEDSQEAPETYTIKFDANRGKVTTKSKEVTEGEVYGKLPTPKREKYKFLGWYTKKSDGKKILSTTKVSESHGKTLYARWKREYVVVINAGHQGKSNNKKESIGPGSKTKKAKVAYGTRGVSTKVKESKRNLQVAKRLKKDLQAEGVKVIMIRTSEKVNISNAKRSKIANKKKADLHISLHCDAGGSSTKGITMLVPKKNKWTKKIYKKSLKAGSTVQKQVIKKTKAKNRGISKRGDLTTFNHSTVPVIMIEMGFMTNKSEDKKLGKTSYQKKLSQSMSTGIMKYLKTQK